MDNNQLILIVIAISPFVAWLSILYMLGFTAPDDAQNDKTVMRIKDPLDTRENSSAQNFDAYFTRMLVHTPYIYCGMRKGLERSKVKWQRRFVTWKGQPALGNYLAHRFILFHQKQTGGHATVQDFVFRCLSAKRHQPEFNPDNFMLRRRADLFNRGSDQNEALSAMTDLRSFCENDYICTKIKNALWEANDNHEPIPEEWEPSFEDLLVLDEKPLNRIGPKSLEVLMRWTAANNWHIMALSSIPVRMGYRV